MRFGATRRPQFSTSRRKRDSTAALYKETFAVPNRPMSGRELILAVEDLYNRLSSRNLQQNQFWRALVEHPETVPDSVYFGMCIENYHLLFRESYFDSPVLSFAPSRAVRQIINAFYCEELGHDRLLLQSLESIGLTEAELFESIPLQQTMALCNALSYWARHDPLFFFTTLGPLEGRDVEIDSYVTAMRQKGLPEAFVGPIYTHANINKNSEHGLLTREIFEQLPIVASEDAARIIRQTVLFISIYNQFYSGIWDYYSRCESLLRKISEI
jgi:hypothetical protein